MAILEQKPNDVPLFALNHFKKVNEDREQPVALVITAPSGCGKGTLIRKLINDFPEYFELSVSFTSRNPRVEDKEGVTYHFVSKKDFENISLQTFEKVFTSSAVKRTKFEGFVRNLDFLKN